ncbi:MAG: hypothetical protein LUC86_00720 [Prevotellaceae bacterium]|nr:hypothetical protein [Prevotellaceae bacterium]MCD8303343.1 hypothetical protein [Prevotellaceae bacterium]
MKKLAFLFVAVAAISFASCGNGTQQSEEAVDSTEVEAVDEEPCDTTVCDSVPAEEAPVEAEPAAE